MMKDGLEELKLELRPTRAGETFQVPIPVQAEMLE